MSEGGLNAGSANQLYQMAGLPKPHSSQSSLYSKDWHDTSPRSPLAHSTASSQESSAAELVEHGAARSILGLGNGCTDGRQLMYEATSAKSSLDRAQGLVCALSELPSPRHTASLEHALQNQGTFNGDIRSLNRGRMSSFRTLFEQVTTINPGQSLVDVGMPEAALTADNLVAVIRNLPANQAAIPAIAHGLKFMDSRAVAFLLKDVAKHGLSHRSVEVFEWLRKLSTTHYLSHLCDVFTYTTAISLCGQRQSLGWALELVADMRSRGVACNVHTYSALMNTCIKCGELELALDVFYQLKVDGCTANVVTFNTLVDVYGKLGRWQDAIHVIDEVYLQGLEPEVRTFNTVIIAANMCNKPEEALKVYARMLRLGFAPTATTYTALISSYGKAGQLDKALEVFNLMIQKNCERNVITYGSLISAAERAGRWQLALDLLHQMRRDPARITPNTATFNSLVSACAQGAQSEKAEGLFQSMLSKRCKPTLMTYSALLLAHIRADQWRSALQAWNTMQAASSRPEPWLYASLIQCLWDSGVASAQAQAARLFAQGCDSGAVLPCLHQTRDPDRTLQVLISAPNTSITLLALQKWLKEARDRLLSAGRVWLGQTIQISVGSSSSDSALTSHFVRGQTAAAAIDSLLQALASPFRTQQSGLGIEAVCDAWHFADWVQRPEVWIAIAEIIPSPAADVKGGRDMLSCRNIAAQEASFTQRLKDSYKPYVQAEAQQAARLDLALACYSGSREQYLRLAMELASRTDCSQELVYSAMILLDYSLVAGIALSSKLTASTLVAACLILAAKKSMPVEIVRCQQEMMEALLSSNGGASLDLTLKQMRAVGLMAETPVACPLTALDEFQSQLNQDLALPALDSTDQHLRPKKKSPASSRSVLTKAMTNVSCQHIRPSLMAAAAFVIDRKTQGLDPLWSPILSRCTGVKGPGDPQFDAAVQTILPIVRG